MHEHHASRGHDAHSMEMAADASHDAHTGHEGHDQHAGHSVDMFRNRFWVCLALTIPVLAYAEGLWELVGLEAPDLPAKTLVPFALATVIFFYGGSVFLRSAVGELRARMPGMMTLVALGISTAYLYSAGTTFFLEGEGFYWELATLVDVMLLGHWIEMSSIGRASEALAELANLLPDTAERVTDGGTEEIPVSQLLAGDVVLVRPGARIPADGEVVEGDSHVNEAMLTGESRPVRKHDGDEVIAGTVNEEGALRAKILRTGDETALAGIMRLVEEAQSSKSKAQDVADRAAMWLFYVAVGAGILTAFGWWVLASERGADFVIERAVTVVVIACPHALGLAVPLVIAISTSLSARSGLLVRNRLALERARDVDVVVFDKTGTLTRGELGVVGMTVDGRPDEEALALAAGLEANSEHALARAIVAEAERRGVRAARVEAFEALKGLGVRGRVEGREVHLGGPRLLEDLAVGDGGFEDDAARWSEEGKTVVSLVEDGKVTAVFALADVIRGESKEAVARLKEMGIEVAMITGDSEDVARWVAGEIGLDQYFAQVLPEQKVDRVKDLQAEGNVVAMVGDGVNDAPALVQADVGIAIGAGTDVAIESADVILVRDDPRDVTRVVELSRASYRKMIQNLVWATGYNAVALPLAAGVLAPVGVLLPPAVGALLMSVSTVVVAFNAQLLRRDPRLRPAIPEGLSGPLDRERSAS